ncbi:quinone oxidoreductase family protein [Roseomonas xinghualingensis]|uniref:quinone oxidoreductase family protein n=1 Tax=Roseomonas xinghualingensis TaxID=2986475 RepID=UPI0021F170F6|nr:zinc-binding dehydrogenase [Roseomonas sp. SXEYE001]MCV4209699.1 zinc-binding dehydrogenase [Roseomonas sp. SXEYE001]
MKAIVVTEQGPSLREVPVPKPGPSEVLVRVRAAGLNRADIGVAAGHAHGKQGGAGTVLGLEWAGEVQAVGAEVAEFAPGDRVMCSGAGGYAEYAVTDYGRASKIPDSNMSFSQAATLPVALQTMHDAVVTNGRLERGQAVLVQGASSGVGLMALQIAREMGARLVIGTSTNPGRRARLTEFGAHLAVDSSDPGWPDVVLAATGGDGVDLIVDQVSGPMMNANLRATAILGRIVNVGRLGGRLAPFDFDLHALRRITYTGVTFRTRSTEEVREINRRMRADLWGALEAGRLSLPIAAEFPLDQALEALAHMRANRHFGKILLLP